MSLIPYYFYEENTTLPEEGNFYIIARNGVFAHKDCGHTKGVVKVSTENLPFIKDFVPPKPKSLPIYVNDDDCGELPENGNYYVLSKNGLIAHKDHSNQFVKSVFEDLEFLGIIQTRVHFKLPKIPVGIIFKALTFFRRVWHQYRAEAAVILYFNTEKKEYLLRCPRQEVSGGGVGYGKFGDLPDPVEIDFESQIRTEGFVKVGTIHSHCNFSAYHSGTDTSDEAKWPDGIHITLGNVNVENFSVAASLVMNDNRFQVEPNSVTTGLSFSNQMGFNNASRFTLELTSEEKASLIAGWNNEIEEEWMPKVQGIGQAYKPKKQKYNEVDKQPRTCYGCGAVFVVDITAGYVCRKCNTYMPSKSYQEKRESKVAEIMAADVPEDVAKLEVIKQEIIADVPEDVAIKQEILIEPKLEDNLLSKVYNHACILINHAGHIPVNRLNQLIGTLKTFYKKDIITEDDVYKVSKISNLLAAGDISNEIKS